MIKNLLWAALIMFSCAKSTEGEQPVNRSKQPNLYAVNDSATFSSSGNDYYVNGTENTISITRVLPTLSTVLALYPAEDIGIFPPSSNKAELWKKQKECCF